MQPGLGVGGEGVGDRGGSLQVSWVTRRVFLERSPAPRVGSLQQWEKLDTAGIHLKGRTEGLAWPVGTSQDREQGRTRSPGQ